MPVDEQIAPAIPKFKIGDISVNGGAELEMEIPNPLLDQRAEGFADPANRAVADEAENPKDRLGVKKAGLRFVPQALRILAVPAMQLGAEKYGPMNWRTKRVKMSVYLEAAQRHLAAFEDGQDLDDESGASHLSHAAACLGIIADAQQLGQLEDDRMTPGPAAAMLAGLDKTRG